VWITDEERRIKLNLDGSDLFVPFRLSDLSGALDRDLTDQRRPEKGEAHLGFRLAGGVAGGGSGVNGDGVPVASGERRG
jgi:hypothetical protein